MDKLKAENLSLYGDLVGETAVYVCALMSIISLQRYRRKAVVERKDVGLLLGVRKPGGKQLSCAKTQERRLGG